MGKKCQISLQTIFFTKKTTVKACQPSRQKLLKWSYDGHLLEYGQMAQVSKPIRLLLQIKISKKKVTNEPR
jgi:hypothetical protein